MLDDITAEGSLEAAEAGPRMLRIVGGGDAVEIGHLEAAALGVQDRGDDGRLLRAEFAETRVRGSLSEDADTSAVDGQYRADDPSLMLAQEQCAVTVRKSGLPK